MSIDINVNVRARIAWREDTLWGGIIADHWHDYPRAPELIHDVLEIITIREGNVVGRISVFILRLQHNYRTTVRNLSFGYDAANLSGI